MDPFVDLNRRAVLCFAKLERSFVNKQIAKSYLWSIGEVVHVAHVKYKLSKGPRFVVIKYLANGRDHLQKSFDDTLNLGDKIHLKCAVDDPAMFQIMGRKSKAVEK